MPLVESGYLYTDDLGCAVGSPAWAAWLISHTSFYYTSPAGTFTARKELRSGGGWYWYGYRKHAGQLHKCYLGMSHQLTTPRMADVAQRLAEKAV